MKHHCIFSLLAISFLIFSIQSYAAEYYWVGDAGDWSDYENHWATTSGGGTFHTQPPTALDDVIFDENSFTITGQVINVDTEAFCRSIDFSAVTNQPNFFVPFGSPLNVYGPMEFSEDMIGSIRILRLYGDLTGNDLTFANVSVQNLNIFDSGEWFINDDLRVGNLYISDNATFHTNNYNLEVVFSFFIFDAGVVFNLGSSEMVVRDFNANTEGATINPGTSNIIVSRDFEGGDNAYHKVTMTGSSTIYGANSFEFFEILPGTDASLEFDKTQTINQEILLNGTPDGPINLGSTQAGMQATLSLSSGTVDGAFLILQDINATGGATFNASESIDNGNNTGWNITEIVPLDYYWVGNGGNWSDYATHWATSSGGSEFHSRVPGVLDNVYFDENSFSEEFQVVTIDGDQANCHDMDWTGVLFNPGLRGVQKTLNIYGSLIMAPDMDINVFNYYFFSNETETIFTGNGNKPGTSASFFFEGAGEWTVQDSLVVRELSQSSGTFHSNNQAIHIDFEWSFSTEQKKEVELGTSHVFARRIDWEGNPSDSLFFNAGEALLEISSRMSLTTVLSNSVYNLGNVSFVLGDFQDNGSIFGNYSIDTLTIEAGKTLNIQGGKIISVNQLIASGTEELPISIGAVLEGETGVFNQTEGVVNGEYIQIQDNEATGGADFFAFNSTNLGNVSGWTFVNQEPQTITFDPIEDKLVTAEPFDVSASASSGLPVTFGIVSGPATIDGSTITLTGELGTVTVEANQEGNSDFAPAPTETQSFKVTKIVQTIDFPEIDDRIANDPPFEVVATASSGLPVQFQIVSGPATIDGSTITLTGVSGKVTVEATQPGDESYDEANPINQSFEVLKIEQTINFPEIADKFTDDPPFTVSATTSSGLQVVFSILSGPATLEGDLVTLTGDEGTVEIQAFQQGNAVFMEAVAVNSFEIIQNTGTHIDELVNGEQYAVFPNPVMNRIYIRTSKSEQEAIDIVISDIMGNILKTDLIPSYDEGLYQIDVSQLSKGVYLLEMNTGQTFRFVKIE